MTLDKKPNIFDSIFSKSNLEILKELNKKGALQFKDFRFLINPETNKKFSSRTIAAKLKEFESKEIVANQIIIKEKRKSVGYVITEKGKQTLKILKEAEEKYQKLQSD